ncbi:MAG: ATP-binding protein [Lentisphaeria bacterium]|nr:ATP-binding protein [Lentisphaeria bacterium]
MKVSATNDDWSEIVCCGLENQQIDFKSHQNWETIGRVGRAKFARHAMAMANTQGGYVVVGVGENENGTPNDFTGMTEAEASSFDPSVVGQTINTFADPPVSIDIVRPLVDGKRYVIMVVYPFTDIPHVCCENCEHELHKGGFYIRTPDARSKLAVKASEIHPLIRRALRNQRQMLGRMLRGILYEDKVIEPQTEDAKNARVEDSRRFALKHLGKKAMQSLPCFEAVACPENPLGDVQLADLRNAVEQLERPAISDIPRNNGVVPTSEIFATNESLCGVVSAAGGISAFWEVNCSGLFYIAVSLATPDENRIVKADELSQMLLMALAAMGEFFSLLNHPEALLDINVRILNSEDANLVNVPSSDTQKSHLCHIYEIHVETQRSAADLEGGAAAETAAKLFAEICQRFNAPMTPPAVMELRRHFDQLLH